MKKSEESKKSQKGRFLRVFMNWAPIIGGIYAAFSVPSRLYDWCRSDQPWVCFSAIILVYAVGVSVFIVSRAAFRQYNTEQAIERALTSDITFKEALMSDKKVWDWYVFIVSSVFYLAMGMLDDLGFHMAYKVVGIICLCLAITGFATVLVVMGISVTYHIEHLANKYEEILLEPRKPHQEQRVIFVYKAPEYYW